MMFFERIVEVRVPFLLEQGGNNLSLEVQRWQYFLRKQGFVEVGKVDGSFGIVTARATMAFQHDHGLAHTGKLDAATADVARAEGYVVVPDDFYDDKRAPGFPPRPIDLKAPTSAWRTNALGCFRFIQKPAAFRDRPERIVVKGSCDGSVADWESANIVRSAVPQLIGVHGAPAEGVIRCHRLAAARIRELFQRWADDQLMHLVICWAGAYDPRYIKGKAPGPQAHAEKASKDVPSLSNHAFGAAFDINATDNWIGKVPALLPRRGAVRQLVAQANAAGFFWGGHFQNRKDGMHFELARL
jgi:hypothetical protein